MIREHHTLMALGLASLLILATPLASEAQTQQLERGRIDWNRLIVMTTGIGAANPDMPETARRAMAIRAARLDAYRNLLEAARGVAITSETIVGNYMTQSDVITAKVEGIVQGAKFGEPRYLEDGSVELDARVSLTGAMLDALVYTNPPAAPKSGDTPWNWDARPIDPPAPETPAIPETSAYTGLIIDARGLGVRPALAPKVLGHGGQELYSAATVTREYALKMGVAGYAKELEAAKQDERVTANPIVVKAVDAAGTNRTDVVINDADADRVRSVSQSGNFLKECRLMILVD